MLPRVWLKSHAYQNVTAIVVTRPPGGSIEAFQKRRELVELLVEKITADRDEDGRARINVTYRFGSPPDDSVVSSVRDSVAIPLSK